MYTPELGRFMQTDPIGYYDSMNLYQYCGNNPVNWIDPWGTITALGAGSMLTKVMPWVELHDIINEAWRFTQEQEENGWYWDDKQCAQKAFRLYNHLDPRHYKFWEFGVEGRMKYPYWVKPKGDWPEGKIPLPFIGKAQKYFYEEGFGITVNHTVVPIIPKGGSRHRWDSYYLDNFQWDFYQYNAPVKFGYLEMFRLRYPYEQPK